jgi:uncharacterized protein (UPF0333 family)
MSLRKFLKKEKAQVSLEYFILFSLIAILTIFSFSGFFVNNVKNSLQGENGFFQSAVNLIITDPQAGGGG